MTLPQSPPHPHSVNRALSLLGTMPAPDLPRMFRFCVPLPAGADVKVGVVLLGWVTG
jgi:hypothetical protein